MSKRVKRRKNKGLFNSLLVKFSAALIIIGCGALIITTETDCAEKEKELVLIQEKIDAFNAENMDLQRDLDSDDMSGYMEKVALEEHGYAYPDELRFYDTSRD